MTTPAQPAPAEDQGTPTNPPAPAAPPAPAGGDNWDTSTGKGGKEAVLADLKAARDENKAFKERLDKLAPLERLAAALGEGDPSKGKTEIEQFTERLAGNERALHEERLARWKAEVAVEKGLTAAHVGRLNGTTKDELLADADQLLTLFPAQPAAGLRPDPSQGAKGTATAPSLDEQIAEARKRNDWKSVVRLESTKLAAVAAKQP